MDIKTVGVKFNEYAAARLKAEVEYAGVSQRNLARLLNTTGAQVNHYLNNNRTIPIDFLGRVCKVINADPAEIVNRAWDDTRKAQIREQLSADSFTVYDGEDEEEELISAALDDERHDFSQHGDEDELTQLDP